MGLKYRQLNRGDGSKCVFTDEEFAPGEQSGFPNLPSGEFARLCLHHWGQAYLTPNLMIP